MKHFVSEALSYPFRGNGISMLITGSVLFVVSYIVGWAGIFGLVGGVFLAGYFCATYMTIVETTAVGQAEAPMFPDVSNVLEDLIGPLAKILGVMLVSFLPAIVYVLATGEKDIVYQVLQIIGIIYLPMGALAVIILGYFGAVNPLNVIPSIIRAGGLYWIAIGLLVLVYGFELLAAEALSKFFIVGPLIMGLIGMYVLMVSARILGSLYVDKAEELEWL